MNVDTNLMKMYKSDILYDNDQLSISEKANIIYKVIFQKQKLEWVSEDSHISSNKILEIIREYKIKRSLVSARFSKKVQLCRKVKKSYLKWVASRTSQLIGNHYTLNSLRSDLLQTFPEIGYISLPSMSRIMNKKLQMSHKKLGYSKPTARYQESKEKIKRCLSVLNWFKQNNYHLVYVDEFSVNRNTTNKYGWWRKGISGWKFMEPQAFRMSFIVGLSKTRWEGLVGFKGTKNSERFILFLKGVIMRNEQSDGSNNRRIWVIWDNWSIHKSEIVQKFIKNLGICMIWIVAYSPFLNPAENLIQGIKSKIKRDHGNKR